MVLLLQQLEQSVKNFEDVDASAATGNVTIIGTDSDGSISTVMSSVGGIGNDILSGGSASDTISGAVMGMIH